MKKKQRILTGCIATWICFFIAMLTGSFLELKTNVEVSANDVVSEHSELSATTTPFATEKGTEDISPTPTSVPVSPIATPTPTISPTPTITPTPTMTPTPTVTPTPTPSPSPTPAPYVPKFTVSAITVNINIRKGPSTDYDIIGKLPSRCYAIILGEENGWTKIRTGSIKEAYVSSEFLFSPEEVMSLCDREKLIALESTVTTLNVRSGPGTHYDVVTQISTGQTYNVQLGSSFEDWIAIELPNGTLGYVFEEYTEFSYQLDTGVTLKEIQEIERQKAIAEAMARARIYSVAETTRTPRTMTESELYLFATVIYTEAGNQRYEGMLAVANVILNRMEDGYWGTTLEEVLFAPGQFEGALPEYIKRAQARGIPEQCYQAAREALAGRNNIGNFLFFRTKHSADRTADYVTYTQFYILQDHVFYKKNW